MSKKPKISMALFVFLLTVLGGYGQDWKDFGSWNYPDFDDEIFVKSFITEQLKEKLSSKEFNKYFFASSNDWRDVKRGLYDSDGVVLRKSDSLYFPTLIIRTALTSFFKWDETGSSEAMDIFKAQMKWLATNFYVCDDKYGFWVFTNYSEPYDLSPGWTSVMSQGMGISASLLAYSVTKDETYLKMVDLAIKGFFVPVENGGFRRTFNGGLWFEEYPTTKPSITLNGFVFGIAGLYNFYKSSDSSDIKMLIDESLETLQDNLKVFCGNFTSYYSLKRPFHFAKDILP